MAEGKLGISVILENDAKRVFNLLNKNLDEINKKTELTITAKSEKAVKAIDAMLGGVLGDAGVGSLVKPIMQMSTTTKEFERNITELKNIMVATRRYVSTDFLLSDFKELTNKQKFRFMQAIYQNRKKIIEVENTNELGNAVKVNKKIDRNKTEMANYLKDNKSIKQLLNSFNDEIADAFIKSLTDQLAKSKNDVSQRYQNAIQSALSFKDINETIRTIDIKKFDDSLSKLIMPIDQLLLTLKKLDELQRKADTASSTTISEGYLEEIDKLIGAENAIGDYRARIKYVISSLIGIDKTNAIFNNLYGQKVNENIGLIDDDEDDIKFAKSVKDYVLSVTDPAKFKKKQAIKTLAQKSTKETQAKEQQEEIHNQELMQKALEETSKKYVDISDQVKKYAVSLDEAFEAANKLFEASGNGSVALGSKDEKDFIGFYQRYLSLADEDNVDKIDPIYKMFERLVKKSGRNLGIASNVDDFTYEQLEAYKKLSAAESELTSKDKELKNDTDFINSSMQELQQTTMTVEEAMRELNSTKFDGTEKSLKRIIELLKIAGIEVKNLAWHEGASLSNLNKVGSEPMIEALDQLTNDGSYGSLGSGLYLLSTIAGSMDAKEFQDKESLFAVDKSKYKLFQTKTNKMAENLYNMFNIMEKLIFSASEYRGFDIELKNVNPESIFKQYEDVCKAIGLDLNTLKTFIDNAQKQVKNIGIINDVVGDFIYPAFKPVVLYQNKATKEQARKQKDELQQMQRYPTQLMKQLGWQGIDNTGTTLDDFYHGSIIYDIDRAAPFVFEIKNAQAAKNIVDSLYTAAGIVPLDRSGSTSYKKNQRKIQEKKLQESNDYIKLIGTDPSKKIPVYNFSEEKKAADSKVKLAKSEKQLEEKTKKTTAAIEEQGSVIANTVGNNKTLKQTIDETQFATGSLYETLLKLFDLFYNLESYSGNLEQLRVLKNGQLLPYEGNQVIKEYANGFKKVDHKSDKNNKLPKMPHIMEVNGKGYYQSLHTHPFSEILDGLRFSFADIRSFVGKKVNETLLICGEEILRLKIDPKKMNKELVEKWDQAQQAIYLKFGGLITESGKIFHEQMTDEQKNAAAHMWNSYLASEAAKLGGSLTSGKYDRNKKSITNTTSSRISPLSKEDSDFINNVLEILNLPTEIISAKQRRNRLIQYQKNNNIPVHPLSYASMDETRSAYRMRRRGDFNGYDNLVNNIINRKKPKYNLITDFQPPMSLDSSDRVKSQIVDYMNRQADINKFVSNIYQQILNGFFESMSSNMPTEFQPPMDMNYLNNTKSTISDFVKRQGDIRDYTTKMYQQILDSVFGIITSSEQVSNSVAKAIPSIDNGSESYKELNGFADETIKNVRSSLEMLAHEGAGLQQLFGASNDTFIEYADYANMLRDIFEHIPELLPGKDRISKIASKDDITNYFKTKAWRNAQKEIYLNRGVKTDDYAAQKILGDKYPQANFAKGYLVNTEEGGGYVKVIRLTQEEIKQHLLAVNAINQRAMANRSLEKSESQLAGRIGRNVVPNTGNNNFELIGEPYSNDFVIVDDHTTNSNHKYVNRKLKNGKNIVNKKILEGHVIDQSVGETIDGENKLKDAVNGVTEAERQQAQAFRDAANEAKKVANIKPESEEQKNVGAEEQTNKNSTLNKKATVKKEKKQNTEEAKRIANKAKLLYEELTNLEGQHQKDLKSDYKTDYLYGSDSRDSSVLDRISTYNKKLEEAKKTTEEFKKVNVSDKSDEWVQLNKTIEQYEKNLENINNKDKNNLEKKVDSYGASFDKFIERLKSKKGISGKFTDEYINAKINEGESLQKSINNFNAEWLTNLDTKSPDFSSYLERAILEFDELQKKVNSFKNMSKDLFDFRDTDKGIERIKKLDTQINKLLGYSKISSEHQTELQMLKNRLSGDITESDFNTIKSRVSDINNEMQKFGEKGASFIDKVKARFQSLGAYLTTFVSFYQVVNVIREITNSVKEFDDALTEMRKVSNESVDTLKDYQKQSFDMAKSIGTDALSLQNSTADFMRLGQTLEEAKDSAMSANVLMNVSEFESIDQATDSLIAMKSAYKDLDNMQIIDKLNEVGNNMPIATAGLATALQDSASALTTANNSIDESIALITAGNAITQDPSKTGKGIRTIALRLTGTEEAKAELEEIGEDTENVITTQSKLRSTVMEATKVASNGYKGFDILNPNGSYKSTYEIMLGIADIWQEIKENDAKYGTKRSNLLLESIAGKNRANIASSILESPDLLREAFDYSAEANGSAMRENEKYLDSITGKLNQLKTAYQELGETAVSSDFLKVLTEMGTTGLEGLTKYVDMFGTLPSLIPLVFGGVGALGGGFFNMDKNGNMSYPIFDAFKKRTKFSITNDDKKFLDDIKRLQSTYGDILGDTNKIEAIASGYENISKSVKDVVNSSESLEVMDANINILSKSTSKAKDIFKSFGATFANVAMNMAAGIAIDLAIKGVTYLYDKIVHAREHIQEAMDTAQSSIDEANKSFESQSSSIENVKKRYAELSEGVKVTSNEIKNINLSDEEFNEYLNLNKQLSELAPDLVSGYDTQGNALLSLGDNYSEVSRKIDDYINKLREARNLEVAGNMKDLFAGAHANVEDLKNEVEQDTNKQTAINDNIINLLNSDKAKSDIRKAIKKGSINNLTAREQDLYKKVFKEMNIKASERESGIMDNISYGLDLGDIDSDVLKYEGKIDKAFNAVIGEYQLKAGEYQKEIVSNTEKQKTEWQKLSGSILQALQSNDNYKMLNDQASDAFQSIFNNLDLGQIIDNNNIGNDWGLLESWFNDNLITQISSVSSEVNEALDMQEQFDNNEIAAKDYIDTLDKLFSSDKIKNLAPEIQDALSNSITPKYDDGETLDDKLNLLASRRGNGVISTIENINKYRSNLKELSKLGVDASETVFGNIDTKNRQILEWTEENIEKYRSQIESWGKNPDDFLGSHSTIFGGSNEFDGQEIAFSPMLQTDHGPELLSSDTVNKYINGLIQKASADGSGWTNEELFKLDTEGLEVDGEHIKGLIADIGDTAIATGEAMHLIGENSELQAAIRDTKDFQEYINGLNKEQIQILVDIYEPGMTIDECRAKVEELQSVAAEGIDLNARTDIEEYEKAKEAGGSYLKDYNKYRDMLKAGQEFYNNGQIGNEEYKAIAKAFSVNKMSDVTNWEENSAQLGKYFTEDARDGLYVFLEDLEKLPKNVADVSKDASDNWTMNFSDMEEAAKQMYMPFQMFASLLSATTEYGFTNDFFANEEEGAKVIAGLNEELATEKAKLTELQAQQEQGTLVDENGNVIQEQIDKIAELEERLKSAKKNFEDFVKVSREDMEKNRKSAQEMLDAYAKDFSELEKYNEDGTKNDSYEYLVSEYISKMQEYASKFKIEVPLDFQLDNPDVKSKLTDQGKIQIDVAVNGEEDLASVDELMQSIPEEDRKNVILSYQVENEENAEQVQKQADEYQGKYEGIMVAIDKATPTIDETAHHAEQYEGTYTATLNARDNASSTVSYVQRIINALHGKTVDITTRMTTIKNTIFGKGGSGDAIGTTGFVSSHATGTVLGGMKAYFGGHNIALSEDQKALVGEEGMEGLVRDGQFYLIGENSPEIRDLKKGDIIFSAKQTKAILNGQKTSRGKTIGMASHAEGTANVMSGSYITAFADGLLNAYAGRGSGRGTLGNRSGSGGGSSSPSTKATNNNTKAVRNNTKATNKKTKSTKKNTDSLEKLQKKWDSLEDWIDDWLAAWDRVYNELETYANELHQTYGRQNYDIEKMYTQLDKFNKNYQAMYDRYMKQAAASGLSKEYVDKIQNGRIDIQSITDEKLKARIEEYKRWYDLAQGVRDKMIELKAAQDDLANQKLTNIQDDHDKSSEMISNMIEMYKQRIEFVKTLGESYNSANGSEMDGKGYYDGLTRYDTTGYNYYTNLEDNYGAVLDNQRRLTEMHQKEYDELLKEFNSLVKRGKIMQGDDTWKEWQATLTELQTTIMADKQAFLELKEELMDYHWEGFNKNIETIEYTLKELGDIIEHINSENLFDDNGVITNEGLGYIGTIGIAMSEAKQKLVDYQSAVKTLEKQYKTGNISQERYTTSLREYLDEIRNASNEIDSYKDKLIDLYKNQMQAENDALKENISLRQESLKRLREYETYAKTIRTKNKDINALQAQIASLSGVSTQEGRAELARLRAQLQEAQEDLSDTQQEHRWDMMDQGYSDMAENADKTLDDVTKNLERNTDLQTKIVNEMLDNIKSSYKETYTEINKIITDAGIVLSNRTEQDVNNLSTQKTATSEMDKAEGTVSYDNGENVSTGTVKADNITTSVKTSIELNSLTINKSKTTIYVGASEKLTATKNPTTAQTGAIVWASSNTNVATVSGGTVKGVAAGSATITATCSGKTATCAVTVANKPATTSTKTTTATTTTTTKKNTTATNTSKDGLAVRKNPGNKQKLLTAIPSGKKATLILDSKGNYQTKKADNMVWMKVKYAGKTGWVKQKYLKYAKGAKKIKEDQIGVTQDAGAEMIMSRGRMLVPTQLFKGDTIYPNEITEKLWDIGKLGTEGIKEKIERDLQLKIPAGMNGIRNNTENNFGDYNVTINALQKLDRKEIQTLSDYFYNDWYKRMKKDLAASGIKR